jgi:hypothetical protein
MLWLLSCVAIAAAAHTQNLKPVGAEDVARVEAVERWLLNGTAPPAWWDVRAPADVRKGSELSRGASKRVCSGRLASSGAKVVVKTIVDSGGKLAPDGTVRPRPNGKITPEHRRAHLLGELYYLEALRGRPGVPELRGAYTEEHRGAVAIAAVVDDGGRELTRPDWKAFCRSEPRRAARALLSCLRSVVDLGGYFQTDFSSRQLTPVCKSTSELGRRGQTSEFSISVKSKSIRLIFGRIDRSRQVLEAQRKSLVQTVRLRSH